MKKLNPIYYFYPALILFFIFLSNFLSLDLLKTQFQTFSAWFILSVLTFSVGWAIDKFFGWSHGTKVLFVTIIFAAIFSLIISLFFGKYFYIGNPFLEDLLFFSLRGILLGTMGFFGMAVSQTIRKNTLCEVRESVERETELLKKNAEEKAGIILEKARIEAEKIKMEAEKEAESLRAQSSELKNNIEKLLETEKEVLSKYDNNDMLN